MGESYTVKALSPMHRTIATRMIETVRTIPYLRLVAEMEVDALLEFRKELSRLNLDVRLTLNDLLVHPCATALMDAPAVNIQWVENEIHQYLAADISVITALQDGLATPMIRSADTKTLWQISRELKELTARAASNRLKANEVFGRSFSISNLGMYGVDQFDAIINAPQCAILTIGSEKPSYVVSPKRDVCVSNLMRVTLSIDHRAIDGGRGCGVPVRFAAPIGAVRRMVRCRRGIVGRACFRRSIASPW